MSKVQKIKDHKISKIENLLKENRFLLEHLDNTRKIMILEIEEIQRKLERLEAKEFLVALDSENLDMDLQEILKDD